jgi:hypothetical protein
VFQLFLCVSGCLLELLVINLCTFDHCFEARNKIIEGANSLGIAYFVFVANVDNSSKLLLMDECLGESKAELVSFLYNPLELLVELFLLLLGVTLFECCR